MAQADTGFLLRLFNSITDPLAFYDRDYRINLVNQTLVSLHQLTTAEVIGRHCYEVFHQRQSVCENCHVREVFRTGEPQRRERHITLPDGRQRQFVINSFPVRDEEGQIIRAIEHGHDVTERRRLEHQLTVSEEQYRTLVENAQEGIFMVEDSARVTFANKRLGEMLGVPPNKLRGRLMFDFLDEKAAAIVKSQMEKRRQGAGGSA